MTNIKTLTVASFTNGANRSRYLDGKIGEIIIFDRVVTTKERLSIEAYLIKKWGFKF